MKRAIFALAFLTLTLPAFGQGVDPLIGTWKFNLETGKGANSASASSCVETFRTRVEHGVVLLELPVVSAADDELPPACFEHGETANWSESSPTAGD